MTTVEQTVREACPSWCSPGFLGCDGAHWSDGTHVLPTADKAGWKVVDNLGVYVHQDQERVPEHRDPATMDQRAHVLLHVFGDEGEIDCDARMTPDEARELSRLLLDAAATAEGRAST